MNRVTAISIRKIFESLNNVPGPSASSTLCFPEKDHFGESPNPYPFDVLSLITIPVSPTNPTFRTQSDETEPRLIMYQNKTSCYGDDTSYKQEL